MIPNEEYIKILEYIPIVCVDLVLPYNGNVLLVRRTREPERDKWWFPGGRVFKGEMLENAAERKALEETGVKVKVEKTIGIYEMFFNNAPFDEVTSGIHSINVCYVVVPIEGKPRIILDETSSIFRWINKLDGELEPYIKQVLQDSGVFEQEY